MQIGIDSFAAWDNAGLSVSSSERLQRLVEQIEYADKIGLDVFGVGEHHRREFLDSAPAIILAAAASRTKRIRIRFEFILTRDTKLRNNLFPIH
ncbi:MAG TPA: LLM class flavin-dependent oxidoreductase [Nitrososphaeraceae archaeon]|nr:LLM class flavin-dependent oxidoreductase [Nitrososphaeraceae archaeon]